MGVLLSTLALLGSFATLLHIDIPILWFLRSHNLAAWQRVGDLGEKLGNGGTLVAISLVIGATGLLLKRQALTRLPWTVFWRMGSSRSWSIR